MEAETNPTEVVVVVVVVAVVVIFKENDENGRSSTGDSAGDDQVISRWFPGDFQVSFRSFFGGFWGCCCCCCCLVDAIVSQRCDAIDESTAFVHHRSPTRPSSSSSSSTSASSSLSSSASSWSFSLFFFQPNRLLHERFLFDSGFFYYWSVPFSFHNDRCRILKKKERRKTTMFILISFDCWIEATSFLVFVRSNLIKIAKKKRMEESKSVCRTRWSWSDWIKCCRISQQWQHEHHERKNPN